MMTTLSPTRLSMKLKLIPEGRRILRWEFARWLQTQRRRDNEKAAPSNHAVRITKPFCTLGTTEVTQSDSSGGSMGHQSELLLRPKAERNASSRRAGWDDVR